MESEKIISFIKDKNPPKYEELSKKFASDEDLIFEFIKQQEETLKILFKISDDLFNVMKDMVLKDKKA